MHRERLRPDWRQTVYKYWSRPVGTLPEAFWAQAREMQRVWNALVTARAQAFTDTKDMEKPAKKTRWAAFNVERDQIVKSATLEWEAAAAILDRFQIASRKAIKEGATLRTQTALKQVFMPHRFTGGGLLLADFLEQRSTVKRVRIAPVSKNAYRDKSRAACRERMTTGHFGCDGGGKFDFEVMVHRQIDPRAIVKQVYWCGKHERHRRGKDPWRWSLQIVCEIPPYPTIAEDTRPIAGIDLGWRVMNGGDYLRIGYVADSDGNHYELALPLCHATWKERRHRKYFETNGHNDTYWYMWRHLPEVDAQIAGELERVKALIYADVPAHYHVGWHKLRQGGLVRLMNDIRTNDDMRAELTAWKKENDRLATIRFELWQKLTGQRDWIYRNLAAWLTSRYRAIAWEGDLNLKALAEEKNKTPALINAAHYRQWASLYSLRQAIQNAAPKRSCQVINAPTVGSTVTCAECGEIAARKGGELFLICPNGHRWDNDENASDNLLHFGLGGLPPLARLPAPVPIVVPSILKPVALLRSL